MLTLNTALTARKNFLKNSELTNHKKSHLIVYIVNFWELRQSFLDFSSFRERKIKDSDFNKLKTKTFLNMVPLCQKFHYLYFSEILNWSSQVTKILLRIVPKYVKQQIYTFLLHFQ